MISFDKACEIAREWKPEADYCVEYADHYRFACHAEDGAESDGGFAQPVVVLKENGARGDYTWFHLVAGGKCSDPIRTIELRRFDG